MKAILLDLVAALAGAGLCTAIDIFFRNGGRFQARNFLVYFLVFAAIVLVRRLLRPA